MGREWQWERPGDTDRAHLEHAWGHLATFAGLCHTKHPGPLPAYLGSSFSEALEPPIWLRAPRHDHTPSVLEALFPGASLSPGEALSWLPGALPVTRA